MVPHHAQTHNVADSWRIRVFDMFAAISGDVDQGHGPSANAIQADCLEENIACSLTRFAQIMHRPPGRARLYM